MKKVRLLFILAISALALQSFAQSKSDTIGIENTILNYIEGFYLADEARMEEALYHDLAKRYVTPQRDGRNYVRHMTAMQLVQITRNKKDDSEINGPLQCDIDIVEIYGKVAIARAETSFFNFVDFFHLGFINGEWKIVNVIWEFKPKKE